MDTHEKVYWVVIGMLLMTGAIVFFLSYDISKARSGFDIAKIPLKLGEWKGTDWALDEEILAVVAADTTLMRIYRNGNNEILWFYIGYYAGERFGKSKPHSPDGCYPAQGWSIVYDGMEELSVDSINEKMTVRRMIVEKDDERELVLYWFQSKGRLPQVPVLEKFYRLKDSILHGRSDVAFIRVSARLRDEDIGEVLAYEKDFIREMMPFLLRGFI